VFTRRIVERFLEGDYNSEWLIIPEFIFTLVTDIGDNGCSDADYQ
jgi:hypothetical protein